jgi:transposase
MTVAITRKELGAAELRREAGRCRDARAARRMLALALVLEGGSRAEAARAAGMDRQTLRDWDWVHRYNAEGLAGLSDRRRPGPRPRLSPEQEAELVTAVEQGPDPDRDGVVRWRRVDLRALIEARFAVRLHERCSVGKVLRRLGFARLSVRPRHPKADEAAQEAQEAFKKASPSWYARRFPSAPAASRSRSGSKMVGRGAFNRVGQQGTLTRVWARRGWAPAPGRLGTGATPGPTCSARSARSGRWGPGSSSRTPIPRPPACTWRRSATTSPPARTPWSCSTGRAGWHTAGDLVVPENLTLLPLPRYSPELNPVENVWEYLRQNKLGLRVWPDYGAIVATCCEAWNWLVAAPGRLASITHREWAKAVSN